MMTRRFWVLLHRYVGLAMTVFLILVGLTGSLLVFLPELNRITAPQLFPPEGTGVVLDQAELAERAKMLVPQARINGVYVGERGTAVIYFAPRIDVDTGKPYELAWDSIFLDPRSGKELGRRKYAAISEGWVNLMPFIYQLHCNLALGKFGAWVLGIAALLWTADCFNGLYLTLPAYRRKHIDREIVPVVLPTKAAMPLRPIFLLRWRPAWLVKWKASTFRVNFDLHRAGGLWLWVALLVFAWSSVFMNLHDEVYAPLTRLVLDYPLRPSEGPKLGEPLEEPFIGWRQAHQTAHILMAEQARLHGFVVERPVNLWINREQGNYHYVVHSSLDFQDKRGRTIVIFDANTGALKQLLLPSRQHSGNTVTNWLQTLHEANVFGLPYRIFVCALGLAIVMLSVTGIVVWAKKRAARRLESRRSQAAMPAAMPPRSAVKDD